MRGHPGHDELGSALESEPQFFLLIFFKIFLMWTIFKVLIEFVITLLLFCMFWYFGQEARGILAP